MDQQLQDFFAWQTSLPATNTAENDTSNSMMSEPPMVPSQSYPSMSVPMVPIDTDIGTDIGGGVKHEDGLQCQWDDCRQVYPDPTSLYRHLCDEHIGRFRQGNRCLECRWSQCGVRTLKRDHITSHLKVHVPFRPFECELCGGTFKRSHDLKKHIRRHARSFRLSGSVELRRQPHRGNTPRRMSGLAISPAESVSPHGADNTLAARICEQATAHPYHLQNAMNMASHIQSPSFPHHSLSSPEAAAAVMAAHFALPSMSMAPSHSSQSPISSVFHLTPPRTLPTMPVTMAPNTSAAAAMLFNNSQSCVPSAPLTSQNDTDAAAFVAAVSVVDSYASTAPSRDASLPPAIAGHTGVLSPTPTPPPTATAVTSSMASSPSPLTMPVSMNINGEIPSSYPALTPTDNCFKPDVLQALAAAVVAKTDNQQLLVTSMPSENHTSETAWMAWPTSTPVTLAQLSAFAPVNGKDFSLTDFDSMPLF